MKITEKKLLYSFTFEKADFSGPWSAEKPEGVQAEEHRQQRGGLRLVLQDGCSCWWQLKRQEREALRPLCSPLSYAAMYKLSQ